MAKNKTKTKDENKIHKKFFIKIFPRKKLKFIIQIFLSSSIEFLFFI